MCLRHWIREDTILNHGSRKEVNSFPGLSRSNKKAQLTPGLCATAHDARQRHHSKMAAVPRWPSATILDIIEPEIMPFDRRPRKPFLELDMEWIGCTVCEIFAFNHLTENLILEPNITSIGKAVAKLWPFLYIQDGRQPPSWILSIRKYRHSICRPQKP